MRGQELSPRRAATARGRFNASHRQDLPLAEQYGDPKAATTALLEVVDAEQPPLCVLFGAAPTHMVKHAYAERLRAWADWERVSAAADGD
ncbi:hypothetical protein GCM10018966_068840 [Streptomyces yanii]